MACPPCAVSPFTGRFPPGDAASVGAAAAFPVAVPAMLPLLSPAVSSDLPAGSVWPFSIAMASNTPDRDLSFPGLPAGTGRASAAAAGSAPVCPPFPAGGTGRLSAELAARSVAACTVALFSGDGIGACCVGFPFLSGCIPWLRGTAEVAGCSFPAACAPWPCGITAWTGSPLPSDGVSCSCGIAGETGSLFPAGGTP